MNTTLTFNGLTLGIGTDYKINNLIPSDIDLRQASQSASFRDGFFVFKQNYGARRINIVLTIRGNDSQAFLDNVATLQKAFRASDTPFDFHYQLWDGRVRGGQAFVENFVTVPFTGGFTTYARQVAVNLVCAFPFTFLSGGVNDLITQTVSLVETGGFDLPFDLPFDFASGGNDNLATFNNNGDTTALLKATFTGPVINPQLRNLTTSQIISIDKELLQGESIEVFLSNTGRVVVDNNGVSQEEFFNGDTGSLFLPLGANNFAFTASSFNENATCTLTFTKRYV